MTADAPARDRPGTARPTNTDALERWEGEGGSAGPANGDGPVPPGRPRPAGTAMEEARRPDEVPAPVTRSRPAAPAHPVRR
jgi:hypothetical protein